MHLRSASGLSDGALIQEARELCAADRRRTAQLLIHLGEIDRRRLCLPAGYPSMYRYCVREFRMAEEVAYKRMQVARAARRFPSILERIIEGRLTLSTVLLLKPVLRRRNSEELLNAADGLSKDQVRLLIAGKFPKPDLPTRIAPLPESSPPPTISGLDPDPVATLCAVSGSSSPAAAVSSEPIPSLRDPVPARITPLAPERFGLQTTIDGETQADLVRARELLGPGTQVPDALKRALRLLVVDLEKRKFAAVASPRSHVKASSNPRHIPADVKRDVRQRDQDRCTFVGENNRRCEERSGLEFDHILPVARGGAATVGNLRLRCRGHNQLEADRVFGAEFMDGKRRSAASG